MKISIFNNKEFAIWVDYSKRENCIWVFNITEACIEKLNLWCTCDIVDWELCIIENDNYIKSQIKEKLDRQEEIRKEIIDLWFSSELPAWMTDNARVLRKQELLDELDGLEIEIQEKYETSLIDDVLSSFFN